MGRTGSSLTCMTGVGKAEHGHWAGLRMGVEHDQDSMGGRPVMGGLHPNWTTILTDLEHIG